LKIALVFCFEHFMYEFEKKTEIKSTVAVLKKKKIERGRVAH